MSLNDRMRERIEHNRYIDDLDRDIEEAKANPPKPRATPPGPQPRLWCPGRRTEDMDDEQISYMDEHGQ